MSLPRPLCLQQPTFERRRPLFDLFRLLHPQVRTFLTVPP